MIDTRTRRILDHPTGTLLILAPSRPGFATGWIEQWLSRGLGVLTIGIRLLTRHDLSLRQVITLLTRAAGRGTAAS